MQSTSPRFSLNKIDLRKAGRLTLIIIGGYALTTVAQTLIQIDFGQLNPLVMALTSFAIELGRRFVTDHSQF